MEDDLKAGMVGCLRGYVYQVNTSKFKAGESSLKTGSVNFS